MSYIIQKLVLEHNIDDADLRQILESASFDQELFQAADKVRRRYYGTDVYLRGLIEFTNYCKNNCYYCGLRAENHHLERYRLDLSTILQCCAYGYDCGYRTFVLQGGEDPYFTDERICEIVHAIRKEYKDCAITLSIGEKPRESYEKYFKAGANRYLLRHETADADHYRKIHPSSMSQDNRKRCLFDLKEIGFQVGTGFMVSSPYQTTENLIEDFRFMQKLQPDMIGIGPFLKHDETPFRNFPDGNFELTLRCISIARLLFPSALIPATTALGTLRPDGREIGLKAGANVIMPNITPEDLRDHYSIYNHKNCTDKIFGDKKGELEKRVISAGYQVVVSVGDVAK